MDTSDKITSARSNIICPCNSSYIISCLIVGLRCCKDIRCVCKTIIKWKGCRWTIRCNGSRPSIDVVCTADLIEIDQYNRKVFWCWVIWWWVSLTVSISSINAHWNIKTRRGDIFYNWNRIVVAVICCFWCCQDKRRSRIGMTSNISNGNRFWRIGHTSHLSSYQRICSRTCWFWHIIRNFYIDSKQRQPIVKRIVRVGKLPVTDRILSVKRWEGLRR